MFGDSNDQESGNDVFSESVRPVSWHPSSANSRISHANATTTSDGSQHSTSTTCYGLTVINNDLQSLSSSSAMDQEERSQDEVIWATYFGNNMTMSSYSSVIDDPMSWPVLDAAQPYQYQSAPMDFLSIQHSPPELQDSFGEEDNQLEKQKSRELIGMGLYDPPGSTSPSYGFGREGKGLKLEEEWEPPEPPDDDDDIDNEADQESSEEEVEEAPDPPKVEEQQWGMQASILPPPTNLSGKSFFIDDDDTITNEWWYQQLKKPTVQGAGIGYGWLQHA
jgi:hypothetical protein